MRITESYIQRIIENYRNYIHIFTWKNYRELERITIRVTFRELYSEKYPKKHSQ